MTQNAIYNKELDAYNVPRTVYNAIKSASAKTGANFSYMLEKAAVESGFDADAKAKTSSATGLYQFIESTWLSMVKQHGDKYGLGDYADKISDSGKVASKADRKEILDLRKDPEIASLMAAEFDNGNAAYLEDNVGGEIGSTELYMAHFMGAGGASSFLNAMKKSPNMTAADLFPAEARANRNVFYDSKTGQPRSLQQVYAFFDQKFTGSTGVKNNFSSESVMASRNTATSPIRVNDDSYNPRAARTASATTQNAGNTATSAAYAQDDDAFTRLASLFGTDRPASSVLRMSGSSSNNGWQIFPPSMYSRLSLSPAQLMMLSDFNS